jgi:ABC-type dipeptide/oligopeptide/nickel transport system permease component
MSRWPTSIYLWNLMPGNLGFSFANRQPVLTLILDRARLTLLLMLPALTLAAIMGVVFALAATPRAGCQMPRRGRKPPSSPPNWLHW